MILVDTSVWVDHLRRGEPTLVQALQSSLALCHPFVIGELACGDLRGRVDVLAALGALPQTPIATQAEALAFLHRHKLYGRGIGWIDIHLLASTVLAAGSSLWTRDKRLGMVATDLGLNYQEEIK
ncbi:MAG: type II toxin-antitoxin system VapC family toxin [Gammaproteobacteria bacterium]